MTGEEILAKAARALVADLRVAHDREVIDAAIGWTVLCHDLEQGSVSAHGFWEKNDLPEAMRWADSWQRALNIDIDQSGPEPLGWRCDVMPLNPKDER